MINNYIVESTLGKGQFASVKLCRDQKTGVQYAIKIMNKVELRKKNLYDSVRDELKVLKTLQHPKIIYLYEIINDEQKDNIYLVTEYFSQGSIGSIVAKKN